MRTDKHETTKKMAPLPVAKKRNATILKLEAGQQFTGEFIGRNLTSILNKETGEMQDVHLLHFVATNGERVVIREDKGLKQAFINSFIQEGEKLTLMKKDKLALEGDRTVNQWDIYSA